MTWQPLSERTGNREPDGHYDGVPGHLMSHVIAWLLDASDYSLNSGVRNDDIRVIANRLRFSVPIGAGPRQVWSYLLAEAADNKDFCLDLLDISLTFWGHASDNARTLRGIFTIGASAWTVSPTGTALQSVVADTMQDAYKAAVSVDDEAARELAEAWSKAYGRDANPSDAWDHAIKALECILIPVVVGNKRRATLGDVVGTLNGNQSSKWEMLLPGRSTHAVAPLVEMLQLIWPNPDRHGSADSSRAPSLEEARAVVCVAASLVQWQRQTWIVRKRQG